MLPASFRPAIYATIRADQQTAQVFKTGAIDRSAIPPHSLFNGLAGNDLLSIDDKQPSVNTSQISTACRPDPMHGEAVEARACAQRVGMIQEER